MNRFSYNSSPTLRFSLQSFEEHRRTIVLTPLSAKDELRLQWDALINRTYGMLVLAGYSVGKRDLATLLTRPRGKRARGETLSLIFGIRDTWSEIRQTWLVTTRPISFLAVETLTKLVFPKELGLYARGLKTHEAEIRSLLDYVSQGREHPMIAAMIGLVGTVSINPFDRDSTILGCLLAHLILSARGCDVRGLLNIEVPWSHDKETFVSVTRQAAVSGNYTPWLEYAAQTAVSHLEEIRKTITEENPHHELPAAIFALNDRQRRVLSLLEEPNRKIANKDVQKGFRVSQITASRDLSKLAHLGLLYPHGRGRSVYYTRV